jgi:hypothetical protein
VAELVFAKLVLTGWLRFRFAEIGFRFRGEPTVLIPYWRFGLGTNRRARAFFETPARIPWRSFAETTEFVPQLHGSSMPIRLTPNRR